MKSDFATLPRVLLTPMIVVMLAGVAYSQKPATNSTPSANVSEVKKSTAPATKEEPTSTTTGEDAGNYTVTSSIEFGYRGFSMDGDEQKYKSDLNYKAGPRLFDSSFLMRSKDKGLFDTMLVTSTGWGADPTGNLRLSVENPRWYRFDATYRRFKYFRYLNNIANPNWPFTPIAVPANPEVGLNRFNTKTTMGDFDLTLLPKNEIIKFYIGYSPERYNGPATHMYHSGGNEFFLPVDLQSRANDFRVGADAKLGPVDFSFMQGFRRFRDDSTVVGGLGLNQNANTAQITTFTRNDPVRGSVDYTRFSVHTLVANKLDLTGRILYSNSESDSNFVENITGRNWNPRVTGWPPTPPNATPNTLNLGLYDITSNTQRPSWLFDFGATFLATKHFRLSNTFRVEDFEITGDGLFSDFFRITRNITGGTRTDSVGFNDLPATETTKYRKYQNTIEGDYDFNNRYSIHFGYRYGKRQLELLFSGFNFGSNGSLSPPATPTTSDEFEENHTNAFFGGFKARPYKNWTMYFDAEHGTADNVFTRIGNYNYTNIRFKNRYSPSKRLNFNLFVITRDNANPSEIAGTSIEDFGVRYKSRVFNSSVDWLVTPKFSMNAGYNYNWVNSNAVIDFTYLGVSGIRGNALYYMRLNFFYLESTARLSDRITLYSAYRISDDNGQGNRVSDPVVTGARTLVSSYPMSFQSPEARLAVKLHRRLDWNVGYQYYNYNESPLVGPRPQNYHAHLPYTSLRIYFGRIE
ncbi:MAG TPA: hypothetical protein VL866_19805 [Pyrinomonadaceae bacterium]|nr:hypothetical protein [Pyrinomonadaceae bacterium]